MSDSRVYLDGKPCVPSFRAERGKVTTAFDDEFVLVQVMHPFDIVQGLAESGNISQALWALDGFSRRYADIKFNALLRDLQSMHKGASI